MHTKKLFQKSATGRDFTHVVSGWFQIILTERWSSVVGPVEAAMCAVLGKSNATELSRSVHSAGQLPVRVLDTRIEDHQSSEMKLSM